MRQVLFENTCEEECDIAPISLLLFHISWVMNETAYKYLSSATFPPSAHVYGVLPSSTKKVHKPSQGAALGATLLKILVEVLWGAEGCSFAFSKKFYVNKQYVS